MTQFPSKKEKKQRTKPESQNDLSFGLWVSSLEVTDSISPQDTEHRVSQRSSTTAPSQVWEEYKPHRQWEELDELLGKVQRTHSKMPGKESNSPAPADVEDTTGRDDTHGLQSQVSVAQNRIQHLNALRNGQKPLIHVKTLSWV